MFGLILSAPDWTLDRTVSSMDHYRSMMQLAEVIRTIVATGVMNMSLGRIYMGTISMEGAYRVMRDGYVGEAWTREHHELWYDDARTGKVFVQRPQSSAPPASNGQPAKS